MPLVVYQMQPGMRVVSAVRSVYDSDVEEWVDQTPAGYPELMGSGVVVSVGDSFVEFENGHYMFSESGKVWEYSIDQHEEAKQF